MRLGGWVWLCLVLPLVGARAEDRHGCRFRRTYDTGCSNDIVETANFNPTDPVCVDDYAYFRVPVELSDRGARYQQVMVYRHPEICPPLTVDRSVSPVATRYTWTIWCQGKKVAQGSGSEATCKVVTNKTYSCAFVTALDRKCAPPPSTSWVSRSAVKLDLWGIWTNVFVGTNLQLNAEGAPPYLWKSRDTGIATVNQEGLVTGVKTGQTTIMVWDKNQCYRELLVKVLDMDLMPDVNRDRVIGEDDRNRITAQKPYRFWINDDRDFGDISDDTSDNPGADSDGNYAGSSVSGRSDLLDFFPLWLDIGQPAKAMSPGDGVRLVLRQGRGAAKAVYTDLTRGRAGRFLIEDNNSCGSDLSRPSHAADKVTLSANGLDLPEIFISRIRGDVDKGVLMVEGAGRTDTPISLEAWKGGTLLCRKDLHIRFDDVEKMYRWINLRHVTRGEETKHTNDGPPENYPDDDCKRKQVVFVHGFNTSEQGARGWNAEVFKRLYWAGSHAMYTAVTWQGDETPGHLSPGAYYHADVINAFQVAPALKSAIATIPGELYLAAHSLGNMVASSAIVDHGLNPTLYFMIDAAVAMEAYKASETHPTEMVDSNWLAYQHRLWPSDWHELFDHSDNRHKLAWRGRFGNIPQAINYYSEGEDVLNNNEPYDDLYIPRTEKAWVFQEKVKGGLMSAVLHGVDSHGGWMMNRDYYVMIARDKFGNPILGRMPPGQAAELSDEQLVGNSFFQPFCVAGLYSAEGSEIAADPNIRAKILAEAVPATSRATGRNAINGCFARNIDMMQYKTSGWPREDGRWTHSDLKKVAFQYVYELYRSIISRGGLE